MVRPTSLSGSIVAVIEQPAISRPSRFKLLKEFAKDLYNYDTTSKSSDVALEVLSHKGDLDKAKFLLSNISTNVKNLSAFVKAFQTKHFGESDKRSLGTFLAVAAFTTMIYASHIRKALFVVVPVLQNISDLGLGILNRDIWQVAEAVEGIAAKTLGIDEEEELEDESKEEVEEKTELTEAEALQIQEDQKKEYLTLLQQYNESKAKGKNVDSSSKQQESVTKETVQAAPEDRVA